MKIVKKKSTEICHFYSREKSLYIAWSCFRNVEILCRRTSAAANASMRNRLVILLFWFMGASMENQITKQS